MGFYDEGFDPEPRRRKGAQGMAVIPHFGCDWWDHGFTPDACCLPTGGFCRLVEAIHHQTPQVGLELHLPNISEPPLK